MLTHLTLINFALADHLAIDIEQGFNVLTGETGAGKSLLLDALSACLGERTDTNYVRFGTDKADVTAVFSYQDKSAEAEWLKAHELDDESGEIHLRRVIFATGRSKAWINGRPSSLSELKEIGRLLVQPKGPLYIFYINRKLLWKWHDLNIRSPKTTDLQSVPFDPSGTLPIEVYATPKNSSKLSLRTIRISAYGIRATFHCTSGCRA